MTSNGMSKAEICVVSLTDVRKSQESLNLFREGII